MARFAAALVALICSVGLVVQFNATIAQDHSVAQTLWILARFFTVLTNFALALTMTAIVFGKTLSARFIGGITLAILLVGAVYMILLRGLIDLKGSALLADTLLHKVSPVVAALYWLAFAPKSGLRRSDPILWAAFPIVYLAYALARGMAEAKYAYPFIDLGTLGSAAVAVNSVAIAIVFLIAGIALVAIGRALAARHCPA